MLTKTRPAFYFVALLLLLGCAGSAFASDIIEQAVYNFTSTGPNGGASFPMVMDKAGNLYGTTRFGGTAAHGAVFELSLASSGWQETTLYNFGSFERPTSGVILDPQGNLYGETDAETVYELVPNGSGIWTPTTLWTFGLALGGTSPSGGLILDRSGNLYGTASTSGDLNCNIGGVGCGVVFKLVRNSSGQWNEYVLYRFHDPTGGAQPSGPLALDAKGNLYGVTLFGGDLSCSLFDLVGCGVVFELSPAANGWAEKVLYSFTGGGPNYPVGGIARDSKGNLYGEGSGEVSFGAVFQVSPNANGSWTETTLYSFKGSSDGSIPTAGLLVTRSGKVLGTTSAGGDNGAGVAFLLSENTAGIWNEHVLWAFGLNETDGRIPASGLTADTKGSFYGSTAAGGTNNEGTAFRLSP